MMPDDPARAESSLYVYALQRVLCLAVAHCADEDAERLRGVMAEIVAFINHAFAELDAQHQVPALPPE
jgi:hypothetical protein